MKNYQKELDFIIEKNKKADITPTLLLHACCAPCSSYCLEYLSGYFKITVDYYNPNISMEEEYKKREGEIERYINEFTQKTHPPNPIGLIKDRYDPNEFFKAVRGLEDEPEGGKRCMECFYLRLNRAGEVAREGGYDYFTTTLTISPLKNAKALNDIGEGISKERGVSFLPSDFKKKDGYKRSIELSKEYGLYRQNYCGCVYSRRQGK